MIEIQKLNKTYDRRRATANHVLKNVTVTLPDKGFVCILGPSGCGKTSLLNAIGGLDDFDNGILSTGGVTVKRSGTAQFENERNRSFGYIFQNYYLLDKHSAAYNVYLGLHSLDLPHKEKLRRVRQALEAVDMGRYTRRLVGELSGGQQQRIAIARALARRPRVIFADEPTGNLDEANTHNICGLLRRAAKDSLVLMVTHEERIARFYADRIIRLDQGVITEDLQEWDREDMNAGSDKRLYTGDFQETTSQLPQMNLRILQQPGAAPVELTVVALKDRIVLKLADNRPATLGSPTDEPVILEGQRPVIRRERTEQENIPLFQEPPAPQTRAGKGVTPTMMAKEATSLRTGKGARKVGMRIFLMLLTLLTLLTAGDFIAISQIKPEQYITGDSHVLIIKAADGPNAESSQTDNVAGKAAQQAYFSWLVEQLPDCSPMGQIATMPSFGLQLFYQMDDVKMTMPVHSMVDVKYLDESTLLYGRMPEHSGEVVADRQVLEAALATEGIVQNLVADVALFLDETLTYGKNALMPTIVGICDSGERAIYMTESAMLSLSLRGVRAVSLSEFRKLYPGQYDNVTLGEKECIAILDNAGVIYEQRVGQFTTINSYFTAQVVDAVNSTKTQAYYVLADETVTDLLFKVTVEEMHLYCPDKEAVKDLIRQGSTWEEEGLLQVTVNDRYKSQYDAYLAETWLRTDARSIVTVTVAVICMVMLGLLCRAQLQDRHTLVAVYRLLGIPGSKLTAIFVLEGLMTAISSVAPVGFVTWATVWALDRFTKIELSLELPWQAVLGVCAAIVGYYLLMALLPLWQLLRLPPARLASKYDM